MKNWDWKEKQGMEGKTGNGRKTGKRMKSRGR